LSSKDSQISSAVSPS